MSQIMAASAAAAAAAVAQPTPSVPVPSSGVSSGTMTIPNIYSMVSNPNGVALPNGYNVAGIANNQSICTPSYVSVGNPVVTGSNQSPPSQQNLTKLFNSINGINVDAITTITDILPQVNDNIYVQANTHKILQPMQARAHLPKVHSVTGSPSDGRVRIERNKFSPY